MNTQISLLQAKYPFKNLAAIDARSAYCSHATSEKGIHNPTPTIHARKPRSRDLIELSLYDEEVGFFVCEETDTIYYMPRSAEQYRTYATHVSLTGAIGEDVTCIAEAALKLSLEELGAMKCGEARIFWIDNEQIVNAYPMIHTTVVKEKREYRVVIEIGRSASDYYTTLLSLSIATNVL